MLGELRGRPLPRRFELRFSGRDEQGRAWYRVLHVVAKNEAEARAAALDPKSPGERSAEIARALESSLEDYGFDVETTAEKLESFHGQSDRGLERLLVEGCAGVAEATPNDSPSTMRVTFQGPSIESATATSWSTGPPGIAEISTYRPLIL